MQIETQTVMSTSSSGYGSLSRANGAAAKPSIPKASSAFGSTLTVSVNCLGFSTVLVQY